MRNLAVLGTAILLAGGLSATSPVDTASAGEVDTSAVMTIEDILEEPSVELIDEEQAIIELRDAGFEVEAVEEDGAEISAELTSELGDGTAVATDLSLDLAEGEGAATLVSAEAVFDQTSLVVEVHGLSDDLIDVTVTDPSTGESQRVSTAAGEGAAIPLVLGIPLVIAALEALVAASAVVIIAGVTYVAISKAIEAINKNGSSYQHFMAARVSGKPLLIGNGITFGSAVTRVKAKSDVWSRTQNGAMTLCKSASGGRTLLPAEKDKSGSYKVWHYHTNPKNGAHCFYGSY